MSQYNVYVDGASRGNGWEGEKGFGAAGVVIYKGNKQIGQLARGLGRVDHNVAEYEAVYLGLVMCWSAGIENPTIYSDSTLVVKQVNREWDCETQEFLPILHSILQLEEVYEFTLTHVPRKHVAVADDLANKILDEILEPMQPVPSKRKRKKR